MCYGTRHKTTLKRLLPILLVVILVLAAGWLPTHNHSIDLLVPSLAFAFALLPETLRSPVRWQEQVGPPLKVHLATAPDRAPPADKIHRSLSLRNS